MPPKGSRWWLTTDSAQTEIAAPAELLYRMVSDMPRMGEWSPECDRVAWTGGASAPAEGVTFVGHNHTGPRGLIKWSRAGRVLTADPGKEFAFVTEEGGRESTAWRYRFEPVAGGTRVTESYEVRWLPLRFRILDVPTNRHRGIVKNIRDTLDRLKAAAERSPAGNQRQPAGDAPTTEVST